MKHRGEIIEKVVRESGISITQVAKQMKKSRRHIYNIFDNPNVPVDIILSLGKIIHHDFSKEFKDLIVAKPYKIENSIDIALDKNTDYGNAEYWKNKYLELLEKYNLLLLQMIKKKK